MPKEFSLKFRRYSPWPLPLHRLIPGQSSAPVEYRSGSSRHEAQAQEQWLGPDLWVNQKQYLYGIDLYNQGFWWEAHEAWEGLWRQIAGDPMSRGFLQGLIKISAAYLKCMTGHWRGAAILSLRGIELLKTNLIPKKKYMGVDLQTQIKHWENHFAVVLRQKDPSAIFLNYPYVPLYLKGQN